MKYEPHEVFLSCVNQTTVDKSTEQWLDAIEDKLDYDSCYCGHYHVYRAIDKLRFLYNDFVELRQSCLVGNQTACIPSVNLLE